MDTGGTRARPAPRVRGMLVAAVLGGSLVLGFPVLGPALANTLADVVATDAPRGGLDPARRAALLEAARAHAQRRAASAREGAPRHVHDSATFDELMAALSGDADSIEGDLGLDGTTAVLRHDVGDRVEFTLDEWLEVVATGGFRVVKLDFKRDPVGPLIDALRLAMARHGVPAERLKLNADVFDGPGARSGMNVVERAYVRLAVRLEPDDLETLVRAFLGATASISAVLGREPGAAPYSTQDISELERLMARMRAAGAREVVLVARWDLLSPELVRLAADGGARIDVWNSLTAAPLPADPRAEEAALRARYGDTLGVVDLRR